MTTLSIDIGNTCIKWALGSDHNLSACQALPHSEDSCFEILENFWVQIDPKPEKIGIACVSSEGVLNKIKELCQSLWPDKSIIILQTPKTAFGVKNGYQTPEKLGIDRWLALIAARQITPRAMLVIDCGTAITIDHLDRNGVHTGGVICPGLNLMKQALVKGTAALKYPETMLKPDMANTTEAGILSGTLWAVLGLIEHVWQLYDPQLLIILTGGDAQLLAPHLRISHHMVPDLVLQGIHLTLRGES